MEATERNIVMGESLQTHSGESHIKHLVWFDLSDIAKHAAILNLEIKPQLWELINVSDTFSYLISIKTAFIPTLEE